MWQGGELKRDFRPCVKNGEACLYDLVSMTYFCSKTSTPLVAGPELKMIVDKIPTAIYREGRSCEPKVVVRTASDGVLGPDRYDVVYENNTSLGTATAVVTGKGALADCVVRRDFLIDYDWTGKPDYFVEYVQATQMPASQFIDTGFRPSLPFKVETELTFDELRDGEFMYLGSRTQTARYYLAYLNNKDWGFGYGEMYDSGHKVPGAPKPAAGERYKCVVNFESGSQTMVVNDQQIFNLDIASDLSIPRALTLFANNAENGANCYVKGKCYSLKIWQGEELKRDFLPCVKNGEACLYDQVSGGFFRNKSKDVPLVAGPGVDWTGKPEYYVEYLQSTEQGKQWINTGVPAKSPFKIDVTMELDRSSGENCFLSCRDANTRLYAIYSTGGNWVSGYGSNFFDTSKKVPGAQTATQAGVRYRVQTEMKNGSQTLIINGATLYDQKVDGDFEVNGKTFPIFAGTDSAGNINYHTPAKCYSCKMWQDGEVVRKLYPCVKNGEPCLLDLVTGEYFRNEAETPFVAGPKCAGPSRGLMLILR